MIELLVTVATLALLAALAAPGMQKLVAAQRLRSASYDLIADFTLARSEALKRASTVQVTPTSSDWRNGWSVVIRKYSRRWSRAFSTWPSCRSM